MKANIQPTLEYINIDGQPDASYERRKLVTAATGRIAHIGHSLAEMAASGLQELVTPIVLDIADHANHTNMREQYFQQKREQAAAVIAERFGIV